MKNNYTIVVSRCYTSGPRCVKRTLQKADGTPWEGSFDEAVLTAKGLLASAKHNLAHNETGLPTYTITG